MNNQPSVNGLAQPLVQALIANAAALRLAVDSLANGTVVVDAGIAVLGGIEAGRRIAEICLGGLGRVSIRAGGGVFPFAVAARCGYLEPGAGLLSEPIRGVEPRIRGGQGRL